MNGQLQKFTDKISDTQTNLFHNFDLNEPKDKTHVTKSKLYYDNTMNLYKKRKKHQTHSAI